MEPEVVDLDARPGRPEPAGARRAPAHPVEEGAGGTDSGAGRRVAPSWSQRLRGPLGAALLAVAAALVSGSLATTSARARAAADAAAEQRAQVRVVVANARVVDARPTWDGRPPDAVVDVTLVNAGPLPVTVLDVSLPSAGDGLIDDIGSRGRVLGPAGATRVQLFGSVACPGGELPYGRGATAGELLVRVRAPDGSVSERPVRASAEELWADGLRPACAQDGG